MYADEEGRTRCCQAISEIHSRIDERLSTDVDVLVDRQPKLLEDLREVVRDEE